jgi:hypothetical protein
MENRFIQGYLVGLFRGWGYYTIQTISLQKKDHLTYQLVNNNLYFDILSYMLIV